MVLEDFKQFKPYFKPSENWGLLANVKFYHVHHLWMIRVSLLDRGFDWPIKIHCCHATNGHARGSYHYRGAATDFDFGTEESLETQYTQLKSVLKTLNLAEFVGLGLYPFWNNPGFHFDSRGFKTRWIQRENTAYVYGRNIIDEYFNAKQ